MTNRLSSQVYINQKGSRGKIEIEYYSYDDLERIMEKSRSLRTNLKVFVVQPGMSLAEASRPQLELLAVTDNYLRETFMVGFGVIASK